DQLFSFADFALLIEIHDGRYKNDQRERCRGCMPPVLAGPARERIQPAGRADVPWRIANGKIFQRLGHLQRRTEAALRGFLQGLEANVPEVGVEVPGEFGGKARLSMHHLVENFFCVSLEWKSADMKEIKENSQGVDVGTRGNSFCFR